MSLLATLRGASTLLLIVVNTVFWATPLLCLAAVKLLLPWTTPREALSRSLIVLAENWISTNNLILRATRALHLELRGEAVLERSEWYLMISNHRSWVDILVLQAAFNRRIPFLKFFIKDQLRWVPLLGLAWWALDMPFMRRHSREYLEKHPEARGQDLDATRRACEKFRGTPTTLGADLFDLTAYHLDLLLEAQLRLAQVGLGGEIRPLPVAVVSGKSFPIFGLDTIDLYTDLLVVDHIECEGGFLLSRVKRNKEFVRTIETRFSLAHFES